jgi:iron complex outermembrane receptor protein
VRLDGGYHKRDGYIKLANEDGRVNNVNRWFARGQAYFENDDINFRLIADVAKTNEDCCGALNTGSGFSLPLTSTNNAIAFHREQRDRSAVGKPAGGRRCWP